MASNEVFLPTLREAVAKLMNGNEINCSGGL